MVSVKKGQKGQIVVGQRLAIGSRFGIRDVGRERGLHSAIVSFKAAAAAGAAAATAHDAACSGDDRRRRTSAASARSKSIVIVIDVKNVVTGSRRKCNRKNSINLISQLPKLVFVAQADFEATDESHVDLKLGQHVEVVGRRLVDGENVWKKISARKALCRRDCSLSGSYELSASREREAYARRRRRQACARRRGRADGRFTTRRRWFSESTN